VVAILRLFPGRRENPSPASRLLGWQPLTLLGQVIPREKPEPASALKFKAGDLVRFRVKKTVGRDEWQKGLVVTPVGGQLYDIANVAGSLVRRHASQLRRAEMSDEEEKQLKGNLPEGPAQGKEAESPNRGTRVIPT